MPRGRAQLGQALALVLAACSACSDTALRTPEQRGRALFRDTALSSSTVNRFSCNTCHEAEPEAGSSAIRAGAPLAGVTERATFWGRQEIDLLASINQCLRLFMQETVPLVADDPRAEALYVFLASLPADHTDEVPFTLIAPVPLPRGDERRGAALYQDSCQVCHGARHTGSGRLTPFAPVLPEDTHEDHEGETEDTIRFSVIDKTRHGGFFGVGGVMPPFSLEVLSDEQLSDILEYLEFFGDP
jgi:thiosulfate dehydrogenase